jgi:hypothetical protein
LMVVAGKVWQCHNRIVSGTGIVTELSRLL